MLLYCPDCEKRLKEGQHRYADGVYLVKYCKKCGFRDEHPPGSPWNR